jgi:DNA ligase (NAD+)
VNQINQRDDLGRTSKHIKWAIAYKFDSEQARTKVLAITFQVGRTGKVVPVAELEPIFFMGTTTRRATLHNMNEIGRLGLHVGDYVLIEKGGDIIPKVVGVDVSAREKGAEPIPTPTKCPVCGAALEKRPGKIVDLFCSSEECPAKVINKLKYFVSRPCMNIKDLGPAMLEKLLDNGTIKEPLDLYALIPMHFEGLDGVGAKMVGKILDNIEASKEMPPLNLLAGMGIPWIGQGTSTKVMTRFGSWDSLWGATEAEIASVPDVGDLAASNFCLWREQNPDFLSKIKELGMKMEYKAPAVVEGVLNGRVVVVTGTLSDMSRDEAQKAIEANGGIFAKDITKKTNVLVVGADAGSKLAKAEKMGIDIWTEVVFREKAGL